MGNRGVITTEDKKIGIYLHWNGGLDSVNAFLTYCKLRKFRAPERDSYGWARLCQVIGNYFGRDLSVGIGLYETMDCNNGDNGVYIIRNWNVVGREFAPARECSLYDLADFVVEIDKCQPEDDRLGEEFIREYIKLNQQ